jgi:hypothetical protein
LKDLVSWSFKLVVDQRPEFTGACSLLAREGNPLDAFSALPQMVFDRIRPLLAETSVLKRTRVQRAFERFTQAVETASQRVPEFSDARGEMEATCADLESFWAMSTPGYLPQDWKSAHDRRLQVLELQEPRVDDAKDALMDPILAEIQRLEDVVRTIDWRTANDLQQLHDHIKYSTFGELASPQPEQ